MAKGNTVTLTFAGDDRDLRHKIANVVRDSDTLNKKLSGVGKGAGILGAGLLGLGASAAAGAGVAGLAMAALPIAIAAAGAKILTQNENIKKSFDQMGKDINASLVKATAPLEATFTRVASKVKSFATENQGALTDMFAATAPWVEGLATSLLNVAENLIPMFTNAIKASGPILEAMKYAIETIGSAIGTAFQTFSSESEGAGAGIRMVADGVAWLIIKIAEVLTWLASFAGWIQTNWGLISGFGGAILAFGATVFGIVKVVNAVKTAWMALSLAFAASPIGFVVTLIAGLVAAVIYLWNTNEGFRNFFIGAWNSIKTAAGSAADWITSKWNSFVGWITGIPGRVIAVFKGIGDGIKNAMRSAFNFVADAWNNTVGRLSFSVPTWVPGIGGRSFTAPKLPKFHQGGLVPGAPGSETMAILQAGERVIPRNKADRGGEMNVHFTGNTSDALAQVIMQMIRVGKIQIR